MVHFSKRSRYQHQFFWGGRGEGWGGWGVDERRNFEYTLERKEREKSSITTIKKTKRRLLCAQARSICLFVCFFFSTYYISANTKLTRTPFLAHKEIFWILYGFFFILLEQNLAIKRYAA